MDYRDRPGNDGRGVGLNMDIVLQYLPLVGVVALLFALIAFFINKSSHKKTHSQLEQISSQLSLPISNEKTKAEYTGGLKKRVLQNISSIFLCEFEDGKFDFALGFKSVPFFIYVRHFDKKIIRITNTENGSEYKFQEVVGNTDFGAVTIFDRNNHPITGALEPIEISVSDLNENFKPFFISESSNDRHQCAFSHFSDIYPNTFKIEISKDQYVTTSPVFLSAKKVLGFVTGITPAQYKTTAKDEKGKPIRKLIQSAKMVGVSTREIFNNGHLNLDASAFGPKKTITAFGSANAINSGKYNAKN